MADNSEVTEQFQDKICRLEAELAKARHELESRGIELEANEGVLHMAMDDIRRMYEDLLSSQRKLMQSDKLATIGLLSAGIVHEISNPITVVTLAFSLLNSQIKLLKENLFRDPLISNSKAGQMIRDMEEHIKQGQRCMENMTQIVRSIRMFSRADQGFLTLENINHIIDNTISLVWNSVKGKVQVNKEYGDLLPTCCNAQQLGQVFLNILVNASQAMNEEGVITIRTLHDGKNIYVRISDAGCGMSQEVMDKIFEPFFTTKTAQAGTGLGLSIVQDIIKKHDGEITVESALGKGTTFIVRLPINPS